MHSACSHPDGLNQPLRSSDGNYDQAMMHSYFFLLEMLVRKGAMATDRLLLLFPSHSSLSVS